MSKEKPFHETVADKLLAQLETGNSPFQASGKQEEGFTFQIPFNPSTGKAYRGTNALWLAMQSQNDPRWLTMRQANIIGAKVPKGTKATPISFLTEKDGQTVSQTAWVFNAAQLKKMPSLAESLVKFNEQKTIQATVTEKKTEQQSTTKDQADLQQLVQGKMIAYKNHHYKVLEVAKNGNAKIENLESGEKIRLVPTDGMYQSLLQAKQFRQRDQTADITKDDLQKTRASIDNDPEVTAEPEVGQRKGPKR